MTDMAEIAGEQNVFIYNRKKLEMTGVLDVSALTGDCVEMTLREGSAAVDGEDLKIDSFSSETGKIIVTGKIAALTYFEKSFIKKGGLFRRRS